jgi:uncharacterized protein YjiS (DUF1127 family)
MTAVARHPLTNCQAAYRPLQTRRSGLTESFVRIFRLWHSRIRERRAFASLDYRDLRDMGVSQWDVERELAKPFWKG